jgi:hypothetical protein
MPERYGSIPAASFEGTELPGALSLKLCRRATPLPAAGDGHLFIGSIQTGPVQVQAELELSHTGAAGTLAVGRAGVLRVDVATEPAAGPVRRLTLNGAVLVGVETRHASTRDAAAVLQFVAAGTDGLLDPASWEEIA